MKTRIITFASFLILSVTVATAANFKTLRISDHLGRSMDVLIKTETVTESFDFDTRKIFEQATRKNQMETLDITPFIKPELEVEENLPVYKK